MICIKSRKTGKLPVFSHPFGLNLKFGKKENQAELKIISDVKICPKRTKINILGYNNRNGANW